MSQDEREHLCTDSFGASSLFGNLPNKLQLWDKVARRQLLLHINQHRLHPCHDSMLLCRCRPQVHSPFWPVEDMVQDIPFANEEDDDTGRDYLCPRTRAPVSPTVARPLILSINHDRYYLHACKKGGSSIVPVLQCLETKEMQQVGGQCS